MIYIRRYDIELDPFVAIRNQSEDIRIAKARKRTKRRSIKRSFVSVNRMYPFSRFSGTKYLSDEGRDYKDYIQDELEEIDGILGPMPICNDGYEVTYIFFLTEDMMFTKAGEFRNVDVTNMFKAVEDAVFSHILETDSRVVSVHGYKRVGKIPKVVILLSPGSIDREIDHCGIKASAQDIFDDATLLQSSLQT